MVRDPADVEDAPDFQEVLDALDDPASRTIIKYLDEPMTANELAETCDIPLSTMYRKLDRLDTASLVTEQTDIRPESQHTTRYKLAFEGLHLQLDAEQRLHVTIDRPPRTADERLAEMWSEVRDEL